MHIKRSLPLLDSCDVVRQDPAASLRQGRGHRGFPRPRRSHKRHRPAIDRNSTRMQADNAAMPEQNSHHRPQQVRRRLCKRRSLGPNAPDPPARTVQPEPMPIAVIHAQISPFPDFPYSKRGLAGAIRKSTRIGQHLCVILRILRRITEAHFTVRSGRLAFSYRQGRKLKIRSES